MGLRLVIAEGTGRIVGTIGVEGRGTDILSHVQVMSS
jgi:hypothetical protein